MNGAHFHLMINHFPIIGTIIGMLILLTGLFLKNTSIKQTGLGTLVLSAISISIVLLSGDPAGETVEGLPGVSESMIEHHETIAYSSLWAMIPMGLMAALSFYSYMKKEKAGNTLALVTLILSFITIGMMTWVGITGGQIRHTEIRPGSSAVNTIPEVPEQEDSDND